MASICMVWSCCQATSHVTKCILLAGKYDLPTDELKHISSISALEYGVSVLHQNTDTHEHVKGVLDIQWRFHDTICATWNK